MSSTHRIFLLILSLCFAHLVLCSKAKLIDSENFKNPPLVEVSKIAQGVYYLSMQPDTLSGEWDRSISSGTIIYNIYRINSSGQSVVARRFAKNSSLQVGRLYTYKDQFGVIDTLVYSDSVFFLDTVGTRNNSWVKYGVSVQHSVVSGGGVDFAGGIEGMVVIVDASASRPVFQLTINDQARSTVTPFVSFSGYFDTAGVDTLRVFRFSSILGVDSIESWVPRISNASINTPILLRGTVIDNTGNAVPVLKSADSSIMLMRYDIVTASWPDTIPYGKVGRIDVISKESWKNYFDEFIIDAEGVAFFSKKDTLLSGPGRKIVLLVPYSASVGAELWTPMFDDIGIQDFIGDLMLDTDLMGVDVLTNIYEKKAYVLSDNISFKFDAYGDSSFVGEDLHVWLATRSISSAFFESDTVFDNYFVDSVRLSSSSVKIGDALLETVPVTHRIGSSTIVRGVINVNDTIGYRVSPFLGTANSGDAISLPKLVYVKDAKRLANYMKAGSFFGYGVDELNKFVGGGYRKEDRSKTFVYGLTSKDISIFRSAGWHDVSYGRSLFGAVSQGMRTNFPLMMASFFKGEFYSHHMRKIPFYLHKKVFPGAQVNMSGKEFVLLAFTKGKYFGEPRVLISRFSSPYLYYWDKLPPHISWSKNYDPLVNEVYAPMYHIEAGTERITNLLATNNIFDVYLDVDDPNDGIKAGIRELGIGRISSVKLCFHYKTSNFTEDPVTGIRKFSDGADPFVFELSKDQIDKQAYTYHAINNSSASYSMTRAVFKGIDARGWRKGLWDMWVETEDHIGNKGLAPFGGSGSVNVGVGRFNIRTIEIK